MAIYIRIETMAAMASTKIKYTAVMVEFREHPAYAFVLDNFFSTLSEEWGFILVHGTKNRDFVVRIAIEVAERYGQPERVLKIIGYPVENMVRLEYSMLMKQASFYEKIDTEIMLIFQTDSLLLKPNIHKLDAFLKYDYVGAPWTNEGVGNGGLSLRRKSKMLATIATRNPNNIQDVEDVYFCDDSNPVKLAKPTFEEAKVFSVENVYYPDPVGVHQYWQLKNHTNGHEKMNLLEQRYPELAEMRRLNGF